VKERPILFSAPMVCAILAGTKTQTRRVVKPRGLPCWSVQPADIPRILPFCPYGQPGDRLWVREAFGDCTKGADIMAGMHYDPPLYRADADSYGLLGHDGLGPVYEEEIRWRPSIHMPRKFSRITLEVTDVRVERLQDISEADAKAEGCGPATAYPHQYRDAYAALWEQINGPGSWAANPWVWVVEFKRVTP
jgi:hypothetical protein